MCTLTWRQEKWGYEVYFNRDELRLRPLAIAPSLQTSETQSRSMNAPQQTAARFLAPTDPAGGGTWIAANQFGLTLCLLNGYLEKPESEPTSLPRSRGLLVRNLAGFRRVDQIETRLVELLSKSGYSSFHLVALSPDQSPLGWSWDGEKLASRPVSQPVVSSSRDQVGAEATRRSLYELMVTSSDPEQLLAFQRSHGGGQPSARTPCMHREHAHTVSLTRVRVSQHHVTMEYAAGPPCRTALGAPLVLDLPVLDSPVTADHAADLSPA